jgi:hypothetical protein
MQVCIYVSSSRLFIVKGVILRYFCCAGNYILKVVDKDGVRELDMGDDHVLDTGAEYYARAAGGADAMDTAA